MATRLHVPGLLATAEVGRVHVTRYVDTPTLELAKQAQADYVEFATEQGSATPLLIIFERPYPLASVEVRKYWREVSSNEPSFEAIAMVVGGAVGLMAATLTHLGEQLVAVLGIRFRMFKQPYGAAEWLCRVASCETDPDEIDEIVEELRAIDGDAAGDDA